MKAGRPKYRIKARYITVQKNKDEQICFDLTKTGELKKTRGKVVPRTSNMSVYPPPNDSEEEEKQEETTANATNENSNVDSNLFDFHFQEDSLFFQEDSKSNVFDEFL